jgi:hypothetical protein
MIWALTWRWLGEYVILNKTFYSPIFKQEIAAALSYFHIFFLTAFLRRPLLAMGRFHPFYRPRRPLGRVEV